MNKLILYLSGLLLALRGKFPHAELEHLNFLKVQLNNDDRWLSGTSVAKEVVERHYAMSKDNYRSIPHMEIMGFRHKVQDALIEYKYSKTDYGT